MLFYRLVLAVLIALGLVLILITLGYPILIIWTFKVVKIGNLPDLTLHEARSIEQFYINEKGLKKLEGELENKINSISPSRDISEGAQEFARTAVKVFDLPDL